MEPAARTGLPGALARSEPLPESRGLAWGAVGFGAFLLLGVLLIVVLLVVARNGRIPGVSRGMITALKVFAALQFVLALAIIGGGIAMLASRGRFVWLLYAALAAFALLRIADLVVAVKLGQMTAGGCFGATMVLGLDLWLLVLTENQRRALEGDIKNI